MIKNYLKTAFRHLWKRKIFSAINIVGLAVGMAACLLIFQYVSFELSFDQFHLHGKDIYRVVNDRYQNGKLIQHGTMTYSAIGKALKDDYPQEIAAYTRVALVHNRIIINKEEKTEQNGLAVDNSFLTMFSFPLLAGDRQTSLAQPNALVLSESVTRKIFDYKGNDFQPFIGQLLTIENDSVPYQVMGICKDVPENSQLQFDFLLSYSSLYSGGNGSWTAANHSFKSSFFWHFIQLKPGVDYNVLQARFPAFSQQHFNFSKVSGIEESFYLQSLSKAHLYSDFEYDIVKKGNATVVWGLLVIALFIIIIAWSNYINLTTTKSIERAKEVGVRKVMGALRFQLIRQFLVESLLLNLVSLLLAIILVWSVQSFFNQLLGHNLSMSYLFQKGLNGYRIIGGFALLLVAGILIAGFYPAFVLSSFKPVTILKGKLGNSNKGIALRKTLVVGQFAITVTLIIGSLVIYQQIRFMSKQELGLSIDEMLIIKPPVLTRADDSTFLYRLNDFKEEIKQLAYVKGATGSNRVPGDDLSRVFDVHPAGDSTNLHTLNSWGVNHDFIDVYKMKMLAGRQFVIADQDYKRAPTVILNESAVKLFGYSSPQSGIGKNIVVFGKEREVVGVTADFHHKSLRFPIEPTVLLPAYGINNSISVNVKPIHLPQTIAALRSKYEAFFPGNLFDYYFLDEKFNQQYNDDKLFGKVFGLFAGFAILVACLGLFGLSLFVTALRIKEIGVRKVLGASVSNILLLVSRDFVKLVIIAAVVAFPVAWWVMNKWLQDFAYRIHIEWWVFAVAGILALLIAILTVSFQAIKAAIANPVKSLRTE